MQVGIVARLRMKVLIGMKIFDVDKKVSNGESESGGG
jgi:hypothetical protein